MSVRLFQRTAIFLDLYSDKSCSRQVWTPPTIICFFAHEFTDLLSGLLASGLLPAADTEALTFVEGERAELDETAVLVCLCNIKRACIVVRLAAASTQQPGVLVPSCLVPLSPRLVRALCAAFGKGNRHGPRNSGATWDMDVVCSCNHCSAVVG